MSLTKLLKYLYSANMALEMIPASQKVGNIKKSVAAAIKLTQAKIDKSTPGKTGTSDEEALKRADHD